MNSRYIYKDPVFRETTRYPALSVSQNDRSEILKLLRLISGTLDCTDAYTGVKYKFRTNYTSLPFEENNRPSQNTINNLFPEEVTINNLNSYFIQAFRNRNFYKSINIELTKCIINNKENRYLESFIFLYRILEGICYSIPLIYTSKQADFKHSYKSLQKFFSDNLNEGELGFFRRFLNEVYSTEDFFSSTIDLNLSVIELEHVRQTYFGIYRTKVKTQDLPDETENEELKIKFIGFYSFLISIRNHYFHFLQGSFNQNISSEEVQYPDLFFKPLIDPSLNWISIILFEIIKFDIVNRR